MPHATTPTSAQSEQLEFWRQVVDPRGIGMLDALAEDLASFTHEPVDVVRAKMSTGCEDFKALWCAQSIDTRDRAEVQRFYEEQFVEAYELAYWHGGGLAHFPLNYACAGLFARRLGLKRALDFGSGIGTGSLALAAAGCEVHAADIARRLLPLVRHRMEARGHSIRTIALSNGERPESECYDLITCFDVLEHVPDQHAKLIELQGYLRTGGYLCVNLMDDSSHEDRPMHISSAGNWLSLVRQTGMAPAWSHFSGTPQILYKGAGSRLKNAIGRVVDTLQGV
jgi:2-polyprenyl-3-methyl-5-hydroxy-6-metoxy-1,4-benzoquinol methylase